MDIKFDPYIRQTLPHLLLGLLEATVDPTNSQLRERAPALLAMLEELCEHLRFKYQGKAAADRPEIAATRRAYRAIGDDPTRYRPANEALLRCVLSHRALPSALGKDTPLTRSAGIPFVHILVDINTYVSFQSGFPLGCYDATQIAAPVVLRCGQPGEHYIPIGKPEVGAANRLVLADQHGIFGSPTADSQRTMVTLHSRHVFFAIFGFEATRAAVEQALTQTAALLQRFCDATIVDQRVVEATNDEGRRTNDHR